MVNEQSSLVVIAVVMIIAVAVFIAGFYVGQGNNNTSVGLSGGDKNYLSQLEFVGGFCERQGLISTVIPQQLQDGNVVGVPICIQRK